MCFSGRRVDGQREDDRREQLHGLLPESVEPAWLHQVHSDQVLDAQPGPCGRGDALTTCEVDLALTVVTADCVPVLLAAGERVAAVHAGWRGLAQRILWPALERFDDPSAVTAWIGPSIGPCCYEVGDDVAAEVAAASSRDVIRPGRRDRPHLDLVSAARAQLRELGVDEVHEVGGCTHCDSERLCSYRRDGPRAGRNVSAIWRVKVTDR